jgi:hypothetical protein
MSNDGVTPPPGAEPRHRGGSAYTSHGPIQVVVVQQPKSDGDDIADIFDKLWPEKDDGSDNAPARKLKIKSSPVNLLIAILLAILAILQGLGLIQDHKRSSKLESIAAAPDPELAKQLKSVADGITALTNGGGIKISVSNERSGSQTRGRTTQSDPQLHADLSALVHVIADKLSSNGSEVKVLLVPTAIPQFSLDATGGVSVKAAEPKASTSPPELSIKPCFSADDPDLQKADAETVRALADDLPCKDVDVSALDSKPSPVSIPVKFKNVGQDKLLLLDVRGYWSQGLGDSTGQGLNGICSNQRLAQDGILISYAESRGFPVSIELDPGWIHQSRRQVEEFWKEKGLYLILCTTYRGDDPMTQVTSRSVYRTDSASDKKRSLTTLHEVFSSKPIRLP